MPTKAKAKPKPTGGRPTKLTPETQTLILDGLKLGCSDKAACQRAGISTETLSYWLHKGAEGTEPYLGFLKAYTRTKGDRIAALAGQVSVHAHKDWRAAAWLLAVLEPEQYSEKHRMELTGKDGGPTEIRIIEVPARVDDGPSPVGEAEEILEE